MREANELQMVSLSGEDVVNLPLQNAGEWCPHVETGVMLDADKPTLCLCHHGMRSMQVAMFLTQRAGFAEVYNVEGGIHQYAIQCDPTIGTY